MHAVRGGDFALRWPSPHAGLFRSVALVVCWMRKNMSQQFAGAIFGIRVLAEFAPGRAVVVGAGTMLVDGPICPTWSR